MVDTMQKKKKWLKDVMVVTGERTSYFQGYYRRIRVRFSFSDIKRGSRHKLARYFHSQKLMVGKNTHTKKNKSVSMKDVGQLLFLCMICSFPRKPLRFSSNVDKVFCSSEHLLNIS